MTYRETIKKWFIDAGVPKGLIIDQVATDGSFAVGFPFSQAENHLHMLVVGWAVEGGPAYMAMVSPLFADGWEATREDTLAELMEEQNTILKYVVEKFSNSINSLMVAVFLQEAFGVTS